MKKLVVVLAVFVMACASAMDNYDGALRSKPACPRGLAVVVNNQSFYHIRVYMDGFGITSVEGFHEETKCIGVPGNGAEMRFRVHATGGAFDYYIYTTGPKHPQPGDEWYVYVGNHEAYSYAHRR